MELPMMMHPQMEKREGFMVACAYIGGPDPDPSGWPRKTAFPPRVDEHVKSKNGSLAKISKVVHMEGIGGPFAILELARDTGGSSPIEGSGASL